MPAPPFWNQGLLFESKRAVWKPQTPVWKLQVPPGQSATAKHCFPGEVLVLLHTPPPLYSHSGFGLMLPRLLKLERNGTQPPSLLSKFQGTLSTPGVGPVAEARIPRSSRPFGMVSSPASKVLLSFKSSPSVLLTLPPAVPTTNM